MSGYRLPSPDDPLFAVEEANLEILRYFMATLVLSAPGERDSVAVVRRYLPEVSSFPMLGRPSAALQALGVARAESAAGALQERLIEEFSPEQRATLMALSGDV
ncbi:unnamed protein product [Phaeothamnion confervicola]